MLGGGLAGHNVLAGGLSSEFEVRDRFRVSEYGQGYFSSSGVWKTR